MRWYAGKNHTWALNVADNASGSIVHELNSDLGDTSTGTYSVTGLISSQFLLLQIIQLPSAKANIPVRPKTRVTLTNLTGTFDASMVAVCISLSDSNSWHNHRIKHGNRT